MAGVTHLGKQLIAAPKVSLKFIREARDELKKVAWPTRETTVRYSIIVVISSLCVSAVIGGFDYLLSLLIERVII